MKVLSANVRQEDYDKVIKFLDTYNRRTGKDLSLSKFVFNCIKYFIKEYVQRGRGPKP